MAYGLCVSNPVAASSDRSDQSDQSLVEMIQYYAHAYSTSCTMIAAVLVRVEQYKSRLSTELGNARNHEAGGRHYFL